MTTPTPPKQPKPALDIDPRTKFPRLPEGMIFEVKPLENKIDGLFHFKSPELKVLKWSENQTDKVYGNWSQWQDGKYTEEVFDGTNTQNRWIMDKPARWPFFSEKGHWEHRTREVNHEEPGYTEEVERWGIHRDEYTPEGIMALAGKMAESIWKREALKPLLGKHEPVGRSDLPEEIQVTLRLSHARK